MGLHDLLLIIFLLIYSVDVFLSNKLFLNYAVFAKVNGFPVKKR